MSLDDVDRELMMQRRLDALMFLWQIESGESHFEVRFEGSHEWPWILHHSWFDGSYDSNEDIPERSTGSDAWEDFHGKTLAHAVESAWNHHGAFLICESCTGSGEHKRYGKPGERVPVQIGEHEHITHDDVQILSWTCPRCHGEGMVKP